VLLPVLLAAGFCAPTASSEVPGGEYAVVAELLPIMKSPGVEYEKTIAYDGRESIEWNDNIEGVAVYGNRLNLTPLTDAAPEKFADEWFALTSPEDGSVLGYVEKSGVERIPEYRKTAAEYFMVKADDPEMLLMPGKNAEAGKKYSLSDYGFSLAKGEVATGVGTREEDGKTWLLLEFSTSADDGGVGSRYAWSSAENFTALAGYRPDNSRADEGLVPTRMRFGNYPWNSGERYEGEYREGKLDYLPVTEGLRRSIAERGFEIGFTARGMSETIDVDDMADLYRDSGEFEADFITTDIFLHSFHLIFDHMLQKFERTYLAPRLEENMASAVAELDKLSSGFYQAGEKEVYDTARDMFGVALALLNENPGDAAVSERAAAEAQQVIAAQDVTNSIVTGAMLDYTLFKPRGHYTLSPEFERYFRAMSWLGSAELPLFDERLVPIAKNAAASALISLALEARGKEWNAFEEPVDFLVGAPATGGSEIYRELAKEVFGTLGESTAERLSDAGKIADFARKIRETVPGPVLQSRPGSDENVTDFENRLPVFRVSGKRFTYDAYVMNMLTSPRVGTDENPRNLPEGTDVMAVLGSKAADGLAGKNNGFKNYAENMKTLKDGIDKYLADDGTVYSLWIAALKSGFEDSGSDQFFYNSPAWQWKKLSTQSASWAELKHDTILYVEQSGAEMGNGGEYVAGPYAPPYPRGYVEPDHQTFGALLAAVRRLLEFIEKFGVENDEEWDEKEGRSYSSKLKEFAELLAIARDIAKKEAEGAAIGLDDYSAIKRLAGAFGAYLLLPGEGVRDREQLKMALVADVAADYISGRILEIASGRPNRIYVFVNDASGGARITRGFVFSYYEFERQGDAGRMTDEEWKELVYNFSRADELKKYHPSWYENITKDVR
jgi:hypothetical protein